MITVESKMFINNETGGNWHFLIEMLHEDTTSLEKKKKKILEELHITCCEFELPVGNSS